VLAVDEQAPGLNRVRRLCTVPMSHRHEGFEFVTYEVTEFYWRSAKHDIDKKLRGQVFNKHIQDRAKLAAKLRQERARGTNCIKLSEQYGISVHMVRYYTQVKRKRKHDTESRF
jgi:hypothetical protein